MKKLYALIAVLALLLPVLSGCQSANPLPPQNSGAAATQTTPPETTQPVVTPTETSTRITADEAIAIALNDANLTKDQIWDLDVELDRDAGTLHYDVDFEQDDKDYDYEIDAVTGAILKKKTPAKTASKPVANPDTLKKPTEKKQLTKNQARDIALKHAGLTTAQVKDLEIELDKDGGSVHFDVDFEANGYDYDYEIHAESGKILRSEKNRD